jgi:hypothetical protein
VTTIEGENYKVEYLPESANIAISGALRLAGLGEYAPIIEVLNNALAAHASITLEMKQLEFLNSSGIAMLSKFVIEARNKGTVNLTIHGSSAVPWQGKSLVNLQRLMPKITLVVD